jgi:3-keto-5-aminohexanoate cleavage enzyme
LWGLVVGQAGAIPATPKSVLFLSELLPPDSFWTAVGHGGTDLHMAVLSMSMGGHVRAGFEDNPYYRPGEVALSNAQLIERLVRIAQEIGREVASTAEARAMLGLTARAAGTPSPVEPAASEA